MTSHHVDTHCKDFIKNLFRKSYTAKRRYYLPVIAKTTSLVDVRFLRKVVGGVLALATNSATAFCFNEAGELYNVNPQLLKAIAQVESSGRADAMNMGHVQRTKTYDIGLMQINSSWLKKLEPHGVTESLLRKDPCTNVKVGAWIMNRTMHRVGFNWDGVGAYNASCTTLKPEACRKARQVYAEKVYRAWTHIGRYANRPEAGNSPEKRPEAAIGDAKTNSRKNIRTLQIDSSNETDETLARKSPLNQATLLDRELTSGNQNE